MFKLFIIYYIAITPTYQLNAAHVVAGFKTKEHCETYARIIAKDLTASKYYREGTYECEKDFK